MYSILIIEDDDDYRELLEFGLDNLGHQVKVVSRALQGLELIKKSNFDFVICDILMPEMDGLEFLLNLNQLNLTSSPKSIMISGGGMEHTNLYLDNSTLAGCDAVLSKPFKISQLNELIKATAE